MPLLCTVHVYVAFIFVIVCGLFLFERKLICVGFYCVFMSLLSLKIQLSERNYGIPLTGITPSYFVPVPIQDLRLQRHISWTFVFNGLRLDVVLSVDIGGIVQ